ncbi:MAG: FeoA family protein [Sphaerochaetaceae bacterium]|nr:FeoA family protein [Sphaerochaetaceae bacterium]MDC7237186.1 FeoA family protein [Sphaerochaetaceae bacterium]MDC7250201.1 FeoA family protein [Sphaerochaetaceae bacterium]
MPLSMLSLGESKEIISISASPDLKQRLLSMGFVPGNSVTIVSQSNQGLVLEIKGTRLALNKGLAHLIQVA